ncbi:hypothetical protein K502DRAFT_111447 [Neoconidiobolus thromboides FSU 785]|nr:hypothetical protein K502DRAFT_111447 [Neoconidiobolus thromboides FSU 785]
MMSHNQLANYLSIDYKQNIVANLEQAVEFVSHLRELRFNNVRILNSNTGDYDCILQNGNTVGQMTLFHKFFLLNLK